MKSTIFTTVVLAVLATADEPLPIKLSYTLSSPISQPHTPQFVSYSFEPAFWTEFFGEPSAPNNLTFTLLSNLHARGARPIIRPGGITMDSMIYSPTQNVSVVRTQNPKGGIYRTTIGPSFYQHWDSFPPGTTFISTLNFGNASLPIARDLALASYSLQHDKILSFELGNEPTNYPSTRWNRNTSAYISQWQSFTSFISSALPPSPNSNSPSPKFWASSATTDKTSLSVRPADLIPLGINRTGLVSTYSIHSYAFATCDPARERLATISNILNHTALLHYADTEIYPSAKAALNAGGSWVIGEFNSIACSGKPNVSDTFAQALWTADVELIYAVRNASSVHLHQGATLVFQSNQQLNDAGEDGSPGFSSYSLLYPVDSTKRGEKRVLPVFVSQLLVVEALQGNVSMASLKTPVGLEERGFSAYGVFDMKGKMTRLVVLNMKPYYEGKGRRGSVVLNLGEYKGARVKRMTAPAVDEKDARKVTWAGQSFRNGNAVGEETVEVLGEREELVVRDSEGVLVLFN